MNSSQNDNLQNQNQNQEEVFELVIELESGETEEMAKALGELIVEKGELDGVVVEGGK